MTIRGWIAARLVEISHALKDLGLTHGRDAQRKRYELRKEERALTGQHYTSRSKIRGAFGKCRGPFDPRPALKPAQMRELRAARMKERAA